MLANTVQVRKLVNDTLNRVQYNYCNQSWTDRDFRKLKDDGKRRVSFQIVSNDIQGIGREIKRAFIEAEFDNSIHVTEKYIRVTSKL